MSSHDAIRELLPLAAAGALDAPEQRRVEEHARECPECLRQLENWGLYARALHQMRPPAIPVRLLERTRTRILQERAAAAGVSRLYSHIKHDRFERQSRHQSLSVQRFCRRHRLFD